MNMPQNFADVTTAREVAQSLYPNSDAITIIEHSHDNIVALVDNICALRFPRDKNAYLRGTYEKHILSKLQEITGFTIPRILTEEKNPPYVITSFVPGNHFSSATIATFSDDHQQAFGKSVAQFAYSMHSAFEIKEEIAIRRELGLDDLEDNEPWPIYFKNVIFDKKFPTKVQDTIAKKYYVEWEQLCNVTPSVVVHDDLHTENMKFTGNYLTGVLDFGDTNVGRPEQDLRQLYRISEEIMMIAMTEYQRLSGTQLNIYAVKIWAIMKELADYSKALDANNTKHHSFKRAARNLENWLPEGEWGKGYDLS